MKARMIRMGTAAAAALTACAVAACVYSVAWSPDSSKVIFSLPRREVDEDARVHRLAMTDLEGKLIRDVARPDSEYVLLSPAAWSPDGRWIAYLRIEPAPATKGMTALVSLVLQQADSGEERTIFQTEDPGPPKREVHALLGVPHWSGDSKALLIRNKPWSGLGVLVLDLEGKPLLHLPLEDELASASASLSPDGTRIAYLKRLPPPPEKGRYEGQALYVHDIRSGQAEQLSLVRPEGAWTRPAWSPDSLSLYFAGWKEDKGGKGHGLVQRIDPATRAVVTIWEKPGQVLNISVSPGTGRLGVCYSLSEDLWGVDFVDPETRQATPLHFGGFGFPAVSPDGRWVAFAAWTQKQLAPIGVIVAADGTDLRYFVPEGQPRDARVADFIQSRLDSTLSAIWWHEDMPPWPLRKKWRPNPPSRAELVGEAHDILKRVAGEQKAALFQEAVAYGHAAIYPWLLKNAETEERRHLVPEAREHLAAFLKLYPNHPLGPMLEAEITGLLREEPAPLR